MPVFNDYPALELWNLMNGWKTNSKQIPNILVKLPPWQCLYSDSKLQTEQLLHGIHIHIHINHLCFNWWNTHGVHIDPKLLLVIIQYKHTFKTPVSTHLLHMCIFDYTALTNSLHIYQRYLHINPMCLLVIIQYSLGNFSIEYTFTEGTYT